MGHPKVNSLLITFLFANLSTVFIVAELSNSTEKVSEGEDELRFSERNETVILKERNNFNPNLGARANAEVCNCTSLFQCDLNAADSDEDGADVEVIDIRNQFGSNPCRHYLEICCNLYQPKRPASEQQSRSPQLRDQKCGRRNVNGVGFRIVGGAGEAQLGEFPYMAAITEINRRRDRAEYICGASLIHPRVALTGAHCVSKKFVENLNVRIGEWDTQTENEDPFIHYDRQVDQIIIHEDFRTQKVLKNDIALLILSKDVPMARHIGTVCLSSELNPGKGQRCYASGWGKNLYGKEGSYQSILKKVDLPIVPPYECESTLRRTRLGPNFRLHPSFVCAGGERGKDTCKGDGGSPLVCEIPGTNRYAQYGIVSWGLNCGDPIPGVYVNVPYFVPWIEDKFRKLGLDTSSFTP